MFLFSWIESTLGYLGINQKEAKLVFIGLEDSGKTSLLHILKDKRLSQVVSNKYPQPEEYVMDNIRYRIFDLSGHQSARKLWREYIMHVNAIVFLVDSADRDRFHIAREELHELLESEDFQSIPFLILGNKIDLPSSASEDELRYYLGLEAYQTNTDAKKKQGARHVGLFMCSVRKRSGYSDGFKWINQHLS